MPKYTPAQINQLLTEKQSPRYKSIDRAEQYFRGTQYAGKAHFWDDRAPLLDRAPSVVFPIVRRSIQAITSFCLGEGRFPKFLSGSSEDDKIVDKDFGLNPEESETFDSVMDKLCEQVRLKATARQAMEFGLSQRTVVAICGVVSGKLRVSMIPAKWATPVFCQYRPEEVEQVTISYRYTDQVWEPMEREWQTRVFEFKRVIDERFDTTYLPVEVKPKEQTIGPSPEPTTPDPAKTFEHGFKFCPVLWYKHKAVCSVASDIDGIAIHDGLCDQIDALNFAISSRNRAAIYSSDPQMWEKGFNPDEPPGAMGEQAQARVPNGQVQGTGAEWNGAMRGFVGSSGQARKRGASTVWSSPSSEYEVGMLTLPGDALKAISDDAEDEKNKLYDGMGVVDPSILNGLANVSTQTLKMMFAMHTATCDEEREDFGRCFLLPLVNMLLRIVLRVDKGLYLAGADEIRPILQRFERPVERAPGEPVSPLDTDDVDENTQWFPPTLLLKWGDYFTPSEEENGTVVDHTSKALDAGLITQKMGVEKMRGIHKFQSADQVLDQVKKEKQEKADLEMKQMQAAGTPSNKKPPQKTANGAS